MGESLTVASPWDPPPIINRPPPPALIPQRRPTAKDFWDAVAFTRRQTLRLMPTWKPLYPLRLHPARRIPWLSITGGAMAIAAATLLVATLMSPSFAENLGNVPARLGALFGTPEPPSPNAAALALGPMQLEGLTDSDSGATMPAALVAIPTVDRDEAADGRATKRRSAVGKKARKARRRNAPGLSRDEIIAGVRTNMPSLAACLRGARARGELAAGRHRLVLSWVVDRDASVVAPEMTGPSYLRNTSVPRCVASQMRNAWRFRTARRQSTVRNFPIPIRVP